MLESHQPLRFCKPPPELLGQRDRKLKAQAEAFTPACVVYLGLAFLNRSLFVNKVRDYGRHGRVEANHLQHAAVIRVGEGEAVGGHAHNDRRRVADELAAILTKGL